MPSIVLGSICLLAALLLAVINMFTAPIIAEREAAKVGNAMASVLPGGTDFQPLDLTGYPESITEAYSASNGFVFRATGKGRNGDIVILVGINKDGAITGTEIISESESAGYKEPAIDAVSGTDGVYTGTTLDTFEPIIITGATLTSNGFAEAMKAALLAFEVANGANVDVRTPEKILQDNCNAALGTTGVTYTRWFATELLDGVTKTYVPENGTGFVFVIGENFVGVNENGEVVGATDSVTNNVTPDADTSAKATAAFALASTSEPTQVSIPSGVSKSTVKKIYKTATGNYVFELVTHGYTSEWNEYNYIDEEAPICITVSISRNGTIIDCITTEQSESDGVGDKCASEEYRDGWIGADKNNTDAGTITGATVTATAYKKAIQTAFKALDKLIEAEGGNT